MHFIDKSSGIIGIHLPPGQHQQPRKKIIRECVHAHSPLPESLTRNITRSKETITIEKATVYQRHISLRRLVYEHEIQKINGTDADFSSRDAQCNRIVAKN